MSEPLAALSLLMVLGVTLWRGRNSRPSSGAQNAGRSTALPDLVQCLSVLGWAGDEDGGRRPTVLTPWSRKLLGSFLEQWREDSSRWIDVVHPADRDRVTEAWNRARAVRRDQDLEYRLVASDDRVIWVRDVIRRAVSTAGTPVLHGAWVDITAEKQVSQLDTELRRSQRLECLGDLTSGVAHDFGNLLTVILGRADMIHAALGADDAKRNAVQAIRVAARRASSLVRRLLRFARREEDGPGVADLTGIVSEMHELLRPLMGDRIEVLLDTDETARFVRSERGELEQIILNLAANARDAMPDGGRLIIRTLDTEVEVTDRADTGVRPGRYGVLEVSDTGCGIDRSTRARIFEPFFTTKGPDAGTGLGLAITRRIVEQHGGGITVSSEVGDGTLFRVYLPWAAGAALTPPQERFETPDTLPASRAA